MVGKEEEPQPLMTDNGDEHTMRNRKMSPGSVALQRVLPVPHRELYSVVGALVFWLCVLLSLVTHPWVIDTFTNRLALGLSYLLAFLLQLLGNDIERVGVIIRHGSFGMEITHKCTAVYQIAVLCAGMLAYRSSLHHKAIGILCGICVISSANIIRIVAIYHVGVCAPGWIPFVHNVLGEITMIALVLVIWFLWANRISRVVPGGKRAASV
jgi:exosortase/archaeosortase family protein